MSQQSDIAPWYRPRIWTLIVLMVVAAPIVVANLSHDARPSVENGQGWPPPNATYGWPLIWYWCEFKPSSPALVRAGAHYEMHTEVVEWSAPRLAGNVVIWLAIFGVAGCVSQWLLNWYGPNHTYRLRMLTWATMLLVTVPTVLANLSGDDMRWAKPVPRYGWPLAWHWRDWQHWYGASTKLDYNFSAARMSANLATWLIMLAATGAACEWSLRRYRPRFRWSLRTMLAAIAVIAVLCAWYVSVSTRADLQDPIVSLEAMGSLSLYLERWGPKWLDLVGADRLRRRVVGVDIQCSEMGLMYDDSMSTTDADDQEILKRLGNLPDLRYVKIDVDAQIPGMFDGLAEMRQLRSLRIGGLVSGNGELISEECFAAIGKLTHLEELQLGHVNNVHHLAHLAGLKNLKSLTLGFPWLGGNVDESDEAEMDKGIPLLKHLPALPRLAVLDIRSRSLIGEEDIRHLAVLPRLKSLNLSDSDITEEGLAELASLKLLNELAIGGATATPEQIQALVVLKHLKALHIQRYAAVDKETLTALEKQGSLEVLEAAGDGTLTTESAVLHALEALKELHVERYGGYDKNNRLTTVSLDRGDQIFALESEVDRFLQALNALRKAHPCIVIDADPKWFDPRRGEIQLKPEVSGGGMF